MALFLIRNATICCFNFLRCVYQADVDAALCRGVLDKWYPERFALMCTAGSTGRDSREGFVLMAVEGKEWLKGKAA